MVHDLVDKVRDPVKKAIFISAYIPITFTALLIVTSRFGISNPETLVESANTLSTAWATGGSAQMLDQSFGNLQDLASFIPIGIFTALFRPLPGEIPSFFGFLAGMDSIILLLLVFVGALRLRLRHIRNPVMLWAISLLLIWSTIYGFVSFQNLGTAVRFKLQVMPILLGLSISLAFRKTTKRRIPVRTKENASPVID